MYFSNVKFVCCRPTFPVLIPDISLKVHQFLRFEIEPCVSKRIFCRVTLVDFTQKIALKKFPINLMGGLPEFTMVTAHYAFYIYTLCI